MKISCKLVNRSLLTRLWLYLLLFVTLATWSVSSAIGSSPDEDFVLTSVWCGMPGPSLVDPYVVRLHRETVKYDGPFNEKTEFCTFNPRKHKYQLLPSLVAFPQKCYLDLGQNESAACQQGLKQSLVEKFFESPNQTRYVNSIRYFVSADVESSVVKMRLLNSFLAVVLVVSAASFILKKSPDLLLAWLAVIAPVTSFFVASVNTSSWTLIGTTSFTFAFIGALKNRRKPKIWIPATVLSVFALWFARASRYEGKYVILLLASAILYSEFAPKNFKITKKSMLFGLAILPVIYLVFGYFSMFFGQMNIFNDPRVEVSEGITTTANNLLVNNVITLPRFITGFFGSWGLGWFELELPSTVWLFTFQAFLLVTGFALIKSSNIHRLIFGAFFTTMCMAILYINQKTFSKVGNEIQPRYFFLSFWAL